MASIDTRPANVSISHLSGNTLTIRVVTPVMYSPTVFEWKAQVRRTSLSDVVDATFAITPQTSRDPDEAVTYVSLSSSQTAYLCEDLGATVTVREKGSTAENTIKRYVGRYDIQISGAGGVDPVITVGTGELIIDLDVTRD